MITPESGDASIAIGRNTVPVLCSVFLRRKSPSFFSSVSASVLDEWNQFSIDSENTVLGDESMVEIGIPHFVRYT